MYHLFLRKKIKNKKYAFIIYNLIAIFIFSVIYWACDKYLDDGTSIHEEKKDKKNDYGTFFYWLWFSVITQTTVGYMFFNSNHEVFYNKRSIKLDLFKFINILQCCSIFIISGMAI
tara:strand:- start:111 stop:458 length:348 start_codon:yes stop_codon:yes gene_type:complete